MLLVNDPGSWSAIYWPLEHAPWHGWTPTDLIFPFFLFIVGITTHLSLSKRDPTTVRGKIIRRGLLIILVGLLLNAFPFFWWGKIAGNPDPTFWDRVVWRAQHLRFLGVLQRIGIAYIAAALLTLRTTLRQQIIIIAVILFGYWAALTLTGYTIDEPSQTLAAYTDRLILGTNHIWASSKTWDPEGPLSTIPAVATAMLGVLAGRWIMRRDRELRDRVERLFFAGVAGLLVGWTWSYFFPINKNLWTSSYVVFTAGFACVLIAACLWLIDIHNVRWWTKPWVIYGVNPLVAFAGSGLMARTIDSLIKIESGGRKVSLHQLSFERFFEPFFPEKFASLLWALCFVAFWLAILALLHKRNIIVKL